MHSRNYQYAKVFFRRPVWTSANIRMFIFLFLSAGFILSLAFLAVRQHNFQAKKSRFKTSQQHTYMQRLIRLYEGQNSLGGSDAIGTWYPGAVPARRGDGAAAANGERAAASEETASNTSASTQLVRLPGDNAADIVRYLRSPDQTKISVERAIEEVSYPVRPTQSRSDLPLEAYLARRKSYSSANEQVGSSDPRRSAENGAVAINSASLTDFDVLQGVRDYEQTIAVAKTNERTIKVCVDRQYRLNPLFRGSLVVQFDIHPNGHVMPESIRIISSDIADARVTNCITRNIRRWKNFPQVPQTNGKYTITQKYVF